MIFVTVGTHEQQFDRLIKAVEALETDETKIIQYGYSNVPDALPHYEQFMDFDRVKALMSESSVTITHGGTGSVLNALNLGCPLVVAPRYQRYGEHVDDHQLELVNTLAEDGLIVPYFDGDSLDVCIAQARRAAERSRLISPDAELVKALQRIVEAPAAKRRLGRWL